MNVPADDAIGSSSLSWYATARVNATFFVTL
jgi:hypothetical protein